MDFAIRKPKCKDLPHVFHLEFVMAIELHEEAQSPQVGNRFRCIVINIVDNAGSTKSHHRIVSSA